VDTDEPAFTHGDRAWWTIDADHVAKQLVTVEEPMTTKDTGKGPAYNVITEAGLWLIAFENEMEKLE
jgi:hypothetical protein